MPSYFVVATLSVLLAACGFCMAFRQSFVREWLGRPAPPRSAGEDEDPLAYVLRISGVMIMAFGIIIGGMFTLAHFAA